jgi:hypothetical protein
MSREGFDQRRFHLCVRDIRNVRTDNTMNVMDTRLQHRKDKAVCLLREVRRNPHTAYAKRGCPIIFFLIILPLHRKCWRRLMWQFRL